MKQEVIVSTCDRCHREERMPLNKTGKATSDQWVLPEHWMHVQGNTSTTLVFALDLCGDCSPEVMAAAGKGDQA
jgi:hypothetical protein